MAYKEVNILYEKELLGISSAEALVNTLWLLNSVHFGLRGYGDHRQMAWGDVNLLQKTDGTEYLEYTEWQTKSRSGAEPQNIRTVKPKAFSTQLASLEEIQFFLYKFYVQKRPGLMQQLDVPLHVSINHTRSSVFSNNKS